MARASLRPYDDVVAHALDARRVAGQLFGLGLLGAVLGEARQLHRAPERFDRDGHRADGRILSELALDARGQGRVVDVRTDALLVPGDGAARGLNGNDRRCGGQSKGCDSHGVSPWVELL